MEIESEMCIDWNAISAIGTVAAAVVGIIGIFLNLHEKTRKLSVKFEIAPDLSLYISNNSLRTVIITSIIFSINQHVFCVDARKGLQEIKISPGCLEKVLFNEKDLLQKYNTTGIGRLCQPGDKIGIVVHDSYGRKYNIKTDMTIDHFKR